MADDIRILLADDHDLFRDAVAALIRRDAPEASVKAVGSLDEAIAELRGDERIDVVALDLRMPGMTSLEDAIRLKREFPDTQVVIMSGAATRLDVVAALEGGLGGYLPKTMPGRALLNALKLIASGERYFPPSSLSPASTDGERPAGLSARELEVLGKLRLGSANKEIARALGIEETTVKLHLRSLCAKLKAKNRTDVVVKAMALGLLQ